MFYHNRWWQIIRSVFLYFLKNRFSKMSATLLWAYSKAPITPGTQPNKVRISIIMIEPQPRSYTASGGKRTDNITRQILMTAKLIFLKYLLQPQLSPYQDQTQNLPHCHTKRDSLAQVSPRLLPQLCHLRLAF